MMQHSIVGDSNDANKSVIMLTKCGVFHPRMTGTLLQWLQPVCLNPAREEPELDCALLTDAQLVSLTR